MSADKRKRVAVIGLGRFEGAVARTLQRMGQDVLGADHVVFPEQRMGERVAHLINERLLDFISSATSSLSPGWPRPNPLSACRW